MNAVEIEEAVSKLAEEPFDPANFPYAFLEAFGNPDATIKRLRSGASNKSDVDGGVLQHNNIHIAIAPIGKTSDKLTQLRESPATKKSRAKFILATDGKEFQAEDLTSDVAPVVCDYKDFPDHFGFFLPLAGISTVKQIRESSFDIKATGRLNRLYVELLKDNPEWGKEARRHDMNHFMARLIFSFFAEDTEIFDEVGQFTNTVQRMSAPDSSNTHEIISEIFRAMNTTGSGRRHANLPRWADFFPYVNGGLFAGSTEVPKFSKIARSYLLNIGKLDWKKINPDIFGSMIQAVAEDEERGALGMHYTSVSNIRRVLNPLFLDELRSQLEKAGDNHRALLNLRKRISKIRVFDPACGSGNFLVIAYKDLREIENEINKRRNETHLRTEISLTNFRGIELRDFPAEVARLALIIAEYQCDVLYCGQKAALAEFLPLDADNWVTCGNALRVDWGNIFPQDALDDQSEIYLCGNPPYLGSREQSSEHKEDLKSVFSNRTTSWKALDYVSGWFMKAADFSISRNSKSAFVTTNSICQGQQVPLLWPLLFQSGAEINFAHTNFKWANLAAHNAGVTVVIVGIAQKPGNDRTIYSIDQNGETIASKVPYINAYLTGAKVEIPRPLNAPIGEQSSMTKGNYPVDGGHLLLTRDEAAQIDLKPQQRERFIRPFMGSEEIIQGVPRYCIWITDADLEEALKIKDIKSRIEKVREMRLASKKVATNKSAATAYKFDEIRQSGKEKYSVVVPVHSSENREWLPVSLLPKEVIVYGSAFALFEAPYWNLAFLLSRIHLVWIAAVCGKLETRYRYSNTLGWNTFPLPKLTEQNKADLTRCAEDILLAREAHFPATIADMYDPEKMPENLRRAHERNDEVLERIYIGRKFKNDSERLEKLFELYTKMVAATEAKAKPKSKSKKKDVQA